MRNLVIIVSLVTAGIGGVAAATYDARERAQDRDHQVAAVVASQIDRCQRENVLRGVIREVLEGARRARIADGTLTPAQVDFYARSLAALGPIDCSTPRGG